MSNALVSKRDQAVKFIPERKVPVFGFTDRSTSSLLSITLVCKCQAVAGRISRQGCFDAFVVTDTIVRESPERENQSHTLFWS